MNTYTLSFGICLKFDIFCFEIMMKCLREKKAQGLIKDAQIVCWIWFIYSKSPRISIKSLSSSSNVKFWGLVWFLFIYFDQFSHECGCFQLDTKGRFLFCLKLFVLFSIFQLSHTICLPNNVIKQKNLICFCIKILSFQFSQHNSHKTISQFWKQKICCKRFQIHFWN